MAVWVWGRRSLHHRSQLHPILALVFDKALALSPFDLAITDSYRGMAAQDAAHAAGKTQLKWPNSKHNSQPAQAGHLDPYPINYDNWLLYYATYGIVMAAAKQLGVSHRLRWGGDWDRDHLLNEETFKDLAHWELVLL